jgi:hypothetical protein
MNGDHCNFFGKVPKLHSISVSYRYVQLVFLLLLLLLFFYFLPRGFRRHSGGMYGTGSSSTFSPFQARWFFNAFGSCFKRGRGALVHMFDTELPWAQEATLCRTERSFPIETDCGEFCSAYSILRCDLPLVVYSTSLYVLSCGLVYSAAGLWPYVTCMSVVDSNSVNRVCCSCQEEESCLLSGVGFRVGNPLYCDEACRKGTSGQESTEEEMDEQRCKELRTGCGIHVADIQNWPPGRTCSREDVVNGGCSLCRKPLWCSSDDIGRAEESPMAWMKSYYENLAHVRQCKWKPEDAETFIDTARLFYSSYKHSPDPDIAALNTEINIYVEQSSDEEHASFLESWLGWIFNASTGTEEELHRLYAMREEVGARTGLKRPIFWMHMEKPLSLEKWDENAPCIDLEAPPYNMRVI